MYNGKHKVVPVLNLSGTWDAYLHHIAFVSVPA